MSETIQEIACPEGHIQAVRLPTRLEPSGPGDVRAPLLDPAFGRVTCDTCQQQFRVDHQFTYADYARRHFALVSPPSQLSFWIYAEHTVASLFQSAMGRQGLDAEAAESFLVRLCFGHGQLREKLLLWDAGLDDRLVELAKLEALLDPALGLKAAGRPALVLDHIDLRSSRLWFRAFRLETPHRPEAIYIGLERYMDLRERQDEYMENYPELFESPFVNILRYLLD